MVSGLDFLCKLLANQKACDLRLLSNQNIATLQCLYKFYITLQINMAFKNNYWFKNNFIIIAHWRCLKRVRYFKPEASVCAVSWRVVLNENISRTFIPYLQGYTTVNSWKMAGDSESNW